MLEYYIYIYIHIYTYIVYTYSKSYQIQEDTMEIDLKQSQFANYHKFLLSCKSVFVYIHHR